jgi:Putative polyhydroxyalkanoic acid system protein (PHA_gran_rgn)
MSGPVTVSIPHRLGKEEALRRIKNGFGILRAHVATLIAIDQEEWSGDVVRFQMRGVGQTAAGVITVCDHSVQVEITLPWVLAKIAERLLPAFKRETTLLLERK